MKDKDTIVIRLIPTIDICWCRSKRKLFIVITWLRWGVGINKDLEL